MLNIDLACKAKSMLTRIILHKSKITLKLDLIVGKACISGYGQKGYRRTLR